MPRPPRRLRGHRRGQRAGRDRQGRHPPATHRRVERPAGQGTQRRPRPPGRTAGLRRPAAQPTARRAPVRQRPVRRRQPGRHLGAGVRRRAPHPPAAGRPGRRGRHQVGRQHGPLGRKALRRPLQQRRRPALLPPGPPQAGARPGHRPEQGDHLAAAAGPHRRRRGAGSLAAEGVREGLDHPARPVRGPHGQRDRGVPVRHGRRRPHRRERPLHRHRPAVDGRDRGAARPYPGRVHARGRGPLGRGRVAHRLRGRAYGVPASLALRLPHPAPVPDRRAARRRSAARPGGARRPEPGARRIVPTGRQGTGVDTVPHQQGERTLSARRGVRGHPGVRVHGRRRDLRRGEDPRSGLALGLALRRERRPHAARRPRASRVRPDDPAPRAPARRPAPPHPLYGAFTQTFATELGTLFTDDPPGDAELAAELDKELRKVLPG